MERNSDHKTFAAGPILARPHRREVPPLVPIDRFGRATAPRNLGRACDSCQAATWADAAEGTGLQRLSTRTGVIAPWAVRPEQGSRFRWLAVVRCAEGAWPAQDPLQPPEAVEQQRDLRPDDGRAGRQGGRSEDGDDRSCGLSAVRKGAHRHARCTRTATLATVRPSKVAIPAGNPSKA
jgi:hypothetical protein